MQEHLLVLRVRRGEISMEVLVELLTTRGYLTDSASSAMPMCGFGSSAIEAATQDDFDALFKVLFPGELHEIELDKVAIREVEGEGAFAYALFNANVLPVASVTAILRREVDAARARL